MPMTRLQHEVVISVENEEEGENKVLKFSARNPVTGKFEIVMQIVGDENDFYDLIDRLKKRIEETYRLFN